MTPAKPEAAKVRGRARGYVNGAALMTSDQSWRDEAACKGADPSVFYPPSSAAPTGRSGGSDIVPQAARVLCRSCPVQAACLEHALAYEPYGVWAGTSELQRTRMRRNSQRAARLAARNGAETVASKRCRRCGRERPAEAFDRSNSKADGPQAHCKDCSRLDEWDAAWADRSSIDAAEDAS
jgi:WhiB family redox-sensing transcriptional regulator